MFRINFMVIRRHTSKFFWHKSISGQEKAPPVMWTSSERYSKHADCYHGPRRLLWLQQLRRTSRWFDVKRWHSSEFRKECTKYWGRWCTGGMKMFAFEFDFKIDSNVRTNVINEARPVLYKSNEKIWWHFKIKEKSHLVILYFVELQRAPSALKCFLYAYINGNVNIRKCEKRYTNYLLIPVLRVGSTQVSTAGLVWRLS